MAVIEYEMPELFGATGGRRGLDGTASAPDVAAPSESMLFLMRLGDGDVDEEQVEAALSERPSFLWSDAQGSLEDVSYVPEVLAVAIALGALVMLIAGLALFPL